MTIHINGDPSSGAGELPAHKDRDQNERGISSSGPVSPEEEALIGLYPYSGADIKLVVHMPPQEENQESEEIIQARERLAELESQLEASPQDDQVSSMLDRLDGLRRERQDLLDLLQITPETEQSAIESDVNDLNNQINELTQVYQEARREVEGRAEIQEEIESLSTQIEEEQDYAGVGTVTKTLAEITTLSLSIHRDKGQVRPLGTTYPRSVCRGPRTISGSMVFTVFHNHIMHEFLESMQYRSTGVGDWDRFRYTSAIMDQLPPLDISISFANEYGNLSWMAILGVEFLNEGMVMSIEDLYMEGTAQYIARDYDPIRSVANRRAARNRGVSQELVPTTGTSILMDDLRRRVALRNNPWI